MVGCEPSAHLLEVGNLCSSRLKIWGSGDGVPGMLFVGGAGVTVVGAAFLGSPAKREVCNLDAEGADWYSAC